MHKVILIDNYDSFTHNLARYCILLGYTVEVIANNACTVAEILARQPSHLILSPGPCSPSTAGICLDLITQAQHVPILGICLGHQCIGQVYGGTVHLAHYPRHGQAGQITVANSRLLPNGRQQVGLYHALVVQTPGPDLNVTAYDTHQQIMAIEHRSFPHFGFQFHPESIMSPAGLSWLAQFLRINPCES